jgi:hypothetical protein
MTKRKQPIVRATVPAQAGPSDSLAIEKPGPRPAIPNEQPPEDERQRLQNALYLHQLQTWVYDAVYGPDPFFRALVRDYALQHLQVDAPLPAPIRAWLAFVLRALDDLPTEYRGRPFNRAAHLRFLSRLSDFFEKAPLNEPVTATLERAAQEFKKSMESVRAMYYSEAFALDRAVREQRVSKSREPASK